MSIASASTTVKFHDFPSGTVVHNYQPGAQIAGPIRSISWSNDGNWLAIVPNSGIIEIVSVKKQLKLTHAIRDIESPTCASFHNSTKRHVAVGTKSGQVLIYDIKTRAIKKSYQGPKSPITHIALSMKDNHIAAASEDGQISLFSNLTGALSATFRVPHSTSVTCLRTNPIKRNYVVAGSKEGVVVVWDIHTNKAKYSVASHMSPVTAVAFSPINSDLFVSTGLDRQLCFYDVGTSRCIANVGVENNLTTVDFSPDGKYIVVGSQIGKILVYDVKHLQQPLQSFLAHNEAVKHVSFRKSNNANESFGSFTSENVGDHLNALYEAEPTDASADFCLGLPEEGLSASESKNSLDNTDSFAMAMGLDNVTAESLKSELSKTNELAKNVITHKSTPLLKYSQQKYQSEGNINLVSTPSVNLPNPNSYLSPIVGGGFPKQTQSGADLPQLRQLVQNAVKEEMKPAMDELKKEMSYYNTHTLSNIRQVYLDLVMCMVKNSIKVDNNFNNLRTDLGEYVQQVALEDENLMLKRRVAELESELALLNSNQMN